MASAGIPYAVVRESAVAAWVSRVDEAAVRNTRDVDVLLRRGDFEQAKEALAAAGFVHRQMASLGKAGVMDVFLDGPGAEVRDAIHVLWAGEPVTLESPDLLPDLTQSEPAGDFQLIALPSLVRMKLSAWRDKDRMHLRDLIDVELVDESLLPELPPTLQNRLREILAGE